MLKRFDFFTRSLVTNDGIALDSRGLSPSQPSHEAFSADDFVSCTAGGGRLAFGDARGGVTLMGSMTLKPRRFQLLESESAALLSIVNDILVVVSSSCQIRLYKLGNISLAGDEPPRLLHKLNTPSMALRKRGAVVGGTVPTCFAITKDFKNLAMGFRDGHVLWMVSRDFRIDGQPEEPFSWLVASSVSSNSNSETPTPVSTPEGSTTSQCTAMGFAPDGNGLWVAYENSLVYFDQDRTETVLDQEEGCKRDCGSLAPDHNFFVLGKRDRVAFYNSETAGSCYSILGEREKLATCHHNIVLVSSGEIWRGLGRMESDMGRSSAVASTSIPAPSSNVNGGDNVKQTVQVLDLSNKLIAHEFPLWTKAENDRCAFIAGDDSSGCIFVLTKHKKRLWRLQEKPIESKLDDLLKRNLYSTAASLARSAGCDPSFVADIYRRYGDHLYDKGSYDDAVAQYVQTVGHLETSYVIRKFLDAPRARNLTAYLETLHGVGVYYRPEYVHANPSPEHTTLLLTCYAKLKEEDKIRQLLQNPEAKVNVAAALEVLKETGRFVPALELAKSQGRDAWYVQTLLEMADTRMVHHALSALSFIRERNNVDLFRKHGVKLLELIPAEALACVKSWVLEKQIVKVEEVMECFVNLPKALEELCLEAIMHDGEVRPSKIVFNTCLELNLSHGHLDEAFQVLTHPRSAVDPDLALAIVRRFKFRKGELFLHEKAGRWEMLLQCRMDDEEPFEEVLSLAKAKLASDADSWLGVLKWLSAQSSSPERDSSIRDALNHIEQLDVLPPLLALRVLSEGNNVPLGIVRPYLISQIQRASRQAEADKQEVKQLREDTERMRMEAKVLATEPKVFNATSCCMTGAPLELPVVHFMSGNSYNLSSLPLGSSSSLDKLEDPKCANDQNSVVIISRDLQKGRLEVDEEFFSELQMNQGGESGFALVADYFGKCLFDDDD